MNLLRSQSNLSVCQINAWITRLLVCLSIINVTGLHARDVLTTTEIVERVGPAVVMITTEPSSFGETKQGSGILIENSRRVVTNIHVVAGARSVMVQFPDGRAILAEGFLKADEEYDLVCIQLSRGPTEITPVRLYQSEQIRIGERVIAIGNPRGLTNTVSEGIISGVREFDPGIKVFQTTAPLSPGSSGGGLFNTHGDLIGITSFLHKGGQNLNFAYPVEYILPLLEGAKVKPFTDLRESIFAVGSQQDELVVFVTKTGKKFHRIGCHHLRKSAIPIQLSEAIIRYMPCKSCIGYVTFP